MNAVAERRRAPGLIGAVAGTDHKLIARGMLAVTLVFFILGGLLALLMRLELAHPGMQFISRDTYDAAFTMHGSTMIYLVVTPVAIALGVYMVPLQIGAADIAAPRAALAGLWMYLVGGLTMYSGFFTQDGPGRAGWFAAWPLSDSSATPGAGMDFWVLGVMLAAAGVLLVSGCVLVTALRDRAPGMTMLRMPVFSWTMVVSCLMVIASFPVLILVMALVFLDRQGVSIFEGFNGAVDYQNLFWFYGHPVVYVMFFPFVGCVAEVVSVCSARRFFGYRAAVVSLLAFTALSMSVWAHHMYTTGSVTNQYFALTSTALLVPAGVEYFDLIATMIGGSIVLRTSMLFAIGFILQFFVGGASGIFVASPTLDYHAQDSYIVVAHFHYTLFAGSVFGLFAGVYHWWPKWTGKLLREGLGKLHFALLAIGTNLTFLPMFFLGQEGMPRRVADYPSSTGWGTLNLLETIGAVVIALSVLVFLLNVRLSLRSNLAAGPDPWTGQTLEWATGSPPPRYNFSALPPVHSYAPLLDLREEAAQP